MKRFVYKSNVVIPESYRKDVADLRNYIRDHLGIYISLVDTYTFWSDVSESWCAGWLSITTHYDDMTREEFLLDELEKRGVIVEE